MSSATPSEAVGVGAAALDVERLRADFPILARRIGTSPLSYLDNAATTQKPREVLDAITTYYTSQNANVHRGVHLLSERATLAFEQARDMLLHAFANEVLGEISVPELRLALEHRLFSRLNRYLA